MNNENKAGRTMIEIEVTETAKCTCGWCGGSHKTELMEAEEYNSNRLMTTGQASAGASWEGAKHLAKVSDDFPNRIKGELLKSRSATRGEHTVTIEPKTTVTTKHKKA